MPFALSLYKVYLEHTDLFPPIQIQRELFLFTPSKTNFILSSLPELTLKNRPIPTPIPHHSHNLNNILELPYSTYLKGVS
jgi:hypothetical protein